MWIRSLGRRRGVQEHLSIVELSSEGWLRLRDGRWAGWVQVGGGSTGLMSEGELFALQGRLLEKIFLPLAGRELWSYRISAPPDVGRLSRALQEQAARTGEPLLEQVAYELSALLQAQSRGGTWQRPLSFLALADGSPSLLRARLEELVARLGEAGLRARVLDRPELSAYVLALLLNPLEARWRGEEGFLTLSGGAQDRDWLDGVSPAYLEEAPETLLAGGAHLRYGYLASLPHLLAAGDLRRWRGVDVLAWTRIYPRDQALAELSRLRQRYDFAAAYQAERGRSLDDLAQGARREAEDLAREIAAGRSTLVEMRVLARIVAATPEEGERLWREAVASAPGRLFPARWLQRHAHLEVLPGQVPREIPSIRTDALAAALLFPLGSGAVQHPDGLVLGADRDGNLFALDPFAEAGNNNLLIVGTSGAGKSFLAKLLMLRALLQWPDASLLVLDPKGEYVGFARALERIAAVYRPGEVTLNPLDPGTWTREAVAAQTGAVLSLLGLMVGEAGGLTRAEEAVLELALEALYRERWGTAPLLEDLLAVLDRIAREGVEWMGVVRPGEAGIRRLARSLGDRLLPYVRGTRAWLNAPTADLSGRRLVVFDLRTVPDADLPLVMGVLSLYFLGRIFDPQDRGRKILALDEGWRLFAMAGASRLLEALARTARHGRAALLTLSQSIRDIPEPVKLNSLYRFVGLLEEGDLTEESLRSVGVVSAGVEGALRSIAAGSHQFLFLRDRTALLIRGIATLREQGLFDTDPEKAEAGVEG